MKTDNRDKHKHNEIPSTVTKEYYVGDLERNRKFTILQIAHVDTKV